MPLRKDTKRNRRAAAKPKSPYISAYQSRVTTSTPSPTATLIRHLNRDPDSLLPSDMLQLQRAIGNRAIGRHLAGSLQRKSRDKRGKLGKSPAKIDGKHSQAVGETAIPAEAIQRAPEKTIVTGITHLVKMSDHTLLGGQEGKPLWDGDVVVINSSDHY